MTKNEFIGAKSVIVVPIDIVADPYALMRSLGDREVWVMREAFIWIQVSDVAYIRGKNGSPEIQREEAKKYGIVSQVLRSSCPGKEIWAKPVHLPSGQLYSDIIINRRDPIENVSFMFGSLKTGSACFFVMIEGKTHEKDDAIVSCILTIFNKIFDVEMISEERGPRKNLIKTNILSIPADVLVVEFIMKIRMYLIEVKRKSNLSIMMFNEGDPILAKVIRDG